MKNKGFTLIEMIIIITVIGIMVSVAVPSLRDYRVRQIEADRAVQEQVLNKSLRQYYALEGHYPSKTSFLSGGALNVVAFAQEMAKKTGTIVNTNDYLIDYIQTTTEIAVTVALK
ncbi:MAG: prepilin-type N-terminal cleavage/methylation domain-containing protein [Clostridia bacterium]